MRPRAVLAALPRRLAAVRATAGDTADMSRKHEEVEAVVSYLLQGPERSTLFWWLVEHHDELVEAKGCKRTRWGPLALQLASYGLTDRENKAASPAVVRLTWQRVRKYVANRNAAKALREVGGKRLSRLPPIWRPQEALPSQRPFAPGSPSEVSTIINNENCTPEEALAGLRRILAERSGR